MGVAINIALLFRLACYCAVGALCYSVFVGPVFDWSSALTYCWPLIWPLMLFFHFAFWLLVVMAVVFVGCLCIAVWG